jgi:hypothetical protein
VITAIDMDMSRLAVTRRRRGLSLAEEGVPHRVLVLRLLMWTLDFLLALGKTNYPINIKWDGSLQK